MNPCLANAHIPGSRVVAIGGGTGLSTLLRGWKHHSPALDDDRFFMDTTSFISDLTAIVAVSDDGGSSGRLREEFSMLAPGDLRNCLVALSQDQHLLAQLFHHRFLSKGALNGHSFGNLFLAALSEMTGDFAEAIHLAGELLAIRGHVYPSTPANVTLAARMEDGSTLRGESSISTSHLRIVKVMLDPPDTLALPEALRAIANADLITIGPGSLYTSLIPNLLVPEIAASLSTTNATRVYIANLMTQAQESLGLTVAQHIERIYEHAGAEIFDYALINTAPLPNHLLLQYAAQGAEPCKVDLDRLEAMGIRCITGNFVQPGPLLRHAPDRLAESLLALPNLSCPQSTPCLSHETANSSSWLV